MQNALSAISSWTKKNKIAAVLIAGIFVYVFLVNLPPRRVPYDNSLGFVTSSEAGMAKSIAPGIAPSYYDAAPRPEEPNRKMITNSHLSLQVLKVREALDKIKQRTVSLGGYVVDTSVNTPEFGESGTITVRVPTEKLDETLTFFRGLAVKVVSENISGTDITDSYIDIEERLERLNSTKAKFEQILDNATTVEEILKVQREILMLQDQIDSYTGQLKYFDGASSTTLITIYLSTDELGLPYAPAQAWRPQVIFKQAYRSLLMHFIQLGNAAIWLLVYSPVLILAFVGSKVIKKSLVKSPSRQ